MLAGPGTRLLSYQYFFALHSPKCRWTRSNSHPLQLIDRQPRRKPFQSDQCTAGNVRSQNNEHLVIFHVDWRVETRRTRCHFVTHCCTRYQAAGRITNSAAAATERNAASLEHDAYNFHGRPHRMPWNQLIDTGRCMPLIGSGACNSSAEVTDGSQNHYVRFNDTRFWLIDIATYA